MGGYEWQNEEVVLSIYLASQGVHYVSIPEILRLRGFPNLIGKEQSSTGFCKTQAMQYKHAGY
jgi:hypothetical protein